jgi:two-component system sensor histidine kinase UhpB
MRKRTVPLLERLRNLPLFWQIFVPNVAVLALAATVLALSPASVSSAPTAQQTAGVFGALVIIILVNLILIRRAVRPLEELTRFMEDVEPLMPGQRARVEGGSAELRKLTEVSNDMLKRIETERRDSGTRMLSAQERERVRLARELHDEIGQSITGLMLELDHVAPRTPEPLRTDLREIQESARAIGDELREIVRRLRPEALDDLGLQSALVALAEQFTTQTGITVDRRFERIRPELSPEIELVLYRVAQESLTNVARHAQATKAIVELSGRNGTLELRVADDGIGFGGSHPGSGIQGMRERAMLVGANLRLLAGQDGGAEISLVVPVKRAPQ